MGERLDDRRVDVQNLAHVFCYPVSGSRQLVFDVLEVKSTAKVANRVLVMLGIQVKREGEDPQQSSQPPILSGIIGIALMEP